MGILPEHGRGDRPVEDPAPAVWAGVPSDLLGGRPYDARRGTRRQGDVDRSGGPWGWAFYRNMVGATGRSKTQHLRSGQVSRVIFSGVAPTTRGEARGGKGTLIDRAALGDGGSCATW